ncbi:MAG: ABC transporter substrate-binding protein [Armatimonadetes bacterium]|nr:ABC transporter substrate-binding protein [Armatimonadota bacterium]
MTRRRISSAALLVSSCLVLFALAAWVPEPAGGAAPARRGGVLKYAMTQEPDTLDPARTALAVANRAFMNIFDTLVYKTADGKYHPGLAESWTISPDGKEYTFKLRRGVKFHDGTALDAEAVKFTFDRIVDPETKAGGARSALGPYDSTAVVDAQTVKVRFKSAFAPFMDGLSAPTLSIVSPAAVKKWGTDFGQHPVGSGPFIFKEWVPKSHVIITRNPQYNWAPAIFKHQGPPHLTEVRFNFVLEAGPRMASLETGETNFIEAVQAQDLPRLQGNTKVSILRAPIGGMPFSIMVNVKRTPTDDLKVRRAMTLGFNPQVVVNTLFKGIHERSYGPMARVQWGYDRAIESMYPFDQAKARALLEEAGWKVGAGGIRVKDGRPLKVLMITQPGAKTEGLELIMQAQFKAIGIDMEISHRDRAAGYAAYSVGEHHLAPIFLYVSEPHVMYYAFHSSNIGKGFNRTFYADKRLDEALETGAATTDPASRLRLYSLAQRIVMDQALIIPVYDQFAVYAVSRAVKEIRFDVRTYPWLFDAYVEGAN